MPSLPIPSEEPCSQLAPGWAFPSDKASPACHGAGLLTRNSSPSSPLSEHTPQLEAPQSGCCSCGVLLVVPTEMSPGPLLSHDALHLAYENYHPPLLPQAAHPLKASQPGSPFILLSASHLPSEQASSLEHPTREQPGAALLRIIALSPVAAETSGSESIHQGIVI